MNVQEMKKWPDSDKPRQKLIEKGVSTLSVTELIAILFRTGTRGNDALQLARTVLQDFDNDLHELARMDTIRLSRIKGLGSVKSITLVAAFELGRRCRLAEIKDKPKICSSTDAVSILQPRLSDLSHEEFHVLLLNRSHKVMGHKTISIGGQSGTVVDPKIIFRTALEQKAAAVILSHNHPSGNLNPSESDIQLTKKLREGGRYLDIPVLDHIIIAGSSFYSFADEGML